MRKISENAMKILKAKYLLEDETVEGMFQRVANAVAQAEEEREKWASIFYDLLSSWDFVPGGRILAGAGTPNGQLFNCFVLPIEDSMESIFETLKAAALVLKAGGGTGFSFSKLRPKGDVVATSRGIASGPVSFIKVFDAAAGIIRQGGMRRGANMAILRVDHPDIMEFITCKAEEGSLTNFNISVGITDRFMEALDKDEEFELIHPNSKEVVKRVPAREIFDLMVEMAWRNGEPGAVFLDTINRFNPTPALGEIESTNPCGEQPLLPNEACCLGSINLSRLVRKCDFDWDRLREVTQLAVRFLDNVIDVTRYPLPEIEKMSKGNRKIGLGVMGWADALYQMRIPYDSEEGIKKAEEVMKFINETAWRASEELAREKGPFPFIKYAVKPEWLRRNAAVTTIAPTGSISMIAECSSGIEPVFALVYYKKVFEGERLAEVNKYLIQALKERGIYSEELIKRIEEKGSIRGIPEIPEDIKRVFVTSMDIAPEWHVRMQAAFQKHTGNAVSKTINLPHEATREDVAKAFKLAYELGCKGITIYRYGSRQEQVLNLVSEERKKAGSKVGPRPRPIVTRGATIRMVTGCGKLYVTINEDEKGLIEVFVNAGKSGGCVASQNEAIGRLISLGLRSGIDVEAIIKEMKGIKCPQSAWQDGDMIQSCADAIGKAIELYLRNGKSVESNKADIPPECPECGGPLEFAEGCILCRSCGYTKCG